MAEEKPKTVQVKDILSKDSKETKDKGSKKSEKKPAKKAARKFKHTHIEHHTDGSHTVRHVPADGGEEVSYGKPDLDGVHDGLEEHVGEPNGEEAEEAAEQEAPAQEAAEQAPPAAARPGV